MKEETSMIMEMIVRRLQSFESGKGLVGKLIRWHAEEEGVTELVAWWAVPVCCEVLEARTTTTYCCIEYSVRSTCARTLDSSEGK